MKRNFPTLIPLISLLLVHLLAVSVVHAQEDTYMFVGFGFGGTIVEDAAIENEIRSNFRSAGTAVSSFDMDDWADAAKVYGGYQFHPQWGVEGGYVHIGDFDYEGNISGQSVGEEVRADGFNVMITRYVHLSSRMDLTAKAGWFFWEVKTDANGTSLTDKGSDIAYGMGLAYSQNVSTRYRFEWEQYQDISEGDVDFFSLSIIQAFGRGSNTDT